MAQQPAGSSAGAVANASALEREARHIETMLIAPCCWREQVSVHQSEAAEQVKREIRAMLGTGMSRAQVLDSFVERYGARVLAEPPDQGFGRVLYHAPWIVGLASAAGVLLLIRRMTRRPATEAPTSAAVPGPTPDNALGDGGEAADDERLDDELRALD